MSKFKELAANKRARAMADELSDKFIKDVLTSGNRGEQGGMNLSAYFEQEDPTSEHTDRSTDAFGRVCRELNIVPRSVPEYNMQATTVGEMGNDAKRRLLIGEIAARAWRKVSHQTMSGGDRSVMMSSDAGVGTAMNPFSYTAPRANHLSTAIPISELVAMTHGIASKNYAPFYIEDIAQSTTNPRVNEGDDIPAVLIRENAKTIRLKKYGRMIKATYESLRYMPLDMFSYFIQRVAVKVEAEKVEQIVATLIFGDESGSAVPENFNASSLDVGATGFTLTLKAWFAFKMKFKNPYMITTVLGQDPTILKLMMLNTGTANIPLANAGSWYNAQQVQPINQGLADGVRVGWLDSAPANVLVAFDKRLAVERVFEIGGNISEVDKWIENQTQGLTMTEVEAFPIIEPYAIKTLTLVA